MTYPQTVKSALTSAAALLNNEEAAFEAQLLLQHVLNVNRAWLIAHENDALQPNIHAAFQALLQRRLSGEPIAYILGYREFYGLRLKTTPNTLIPRPDTETLVEAALSKIPISSLRAHPQDRRGNLKTSYEIVSPTFHLGSQRLDSDFRRNVEISNRSENTQELRILDLGTGTGAIALVIAHHRQQAQVTAVDASATALNIAQENAQSLNIANVEFIQSDWFSALNNQQFDVIVSNPPYIEENDAHLNQGDLRFEPASALASGADGLDDIRKIIAQAPHYLKPSAWLMLEHGYDQAEKVANLLVDAGFSEIETIKDLGGNHRVTLGKMNHK